MSKSSQARNVKQPTPGKKPSPPKTVFKTFSLTEFVITAHKAACQPAPRDNSLRGAGKRRAATKGVWGGRSRIARKEAALAQVEPIQE